MAGADRARARWTDPRLSQFGRHRGAVLCKEGLGRSPRIVCPCHRWTYNLDGSLMSAARMPDDFDTSDHGLRPVRVEVVAGVIYICLSDNPPAFDRFRTEMESALAPHDLEVENKPLIADCFEAGVNVRLGTTAWGLWRNREACGALPRAMVGLSDGQRAWTIGFERLVLATGARDCALAFAGWDQPGVMGALAFATLVSRYDAFAGRRVVILGSGALALGTARLALGRGIDVAALIEVRDAAQGEAEGIAVLAGHRLIRAEGGIDGVERVIVADADGAERTIACDTVIMAVDAVPAIELAEVGGAAVATEPMRGGAVIPAARAKSCPEAGWRAGRPG